MPKKIEWKWEQIDDGTRRVKVMGGWLVNTHRIINNGKAMLSDQALVFIADKDYEWMPTAPIVDPEVNKANLAKDYAPAAV